MNDRMTLRERVLAAPMIDPMIVHSQLEKSAEREQSQAIEAQEENYGR